MERHASEQHDAIGERVLQEAARHARAAWGPRLIAAYAIGSLAHGGFSALVSDVDLALVLDDPLAEPDAARVAELRAAVVAGGLPLADRLSVFWGSPTTLSARAPGGRFPPLDRLDLRRFGRLLRGRDVRDQVAEPSRRELIVSGAAFAIEKLATPEVTAQLQDPVALAAADPRMLTKLVLFPVRFLLTARNGEIGRNDAAVTDFSAATAGAAADLARAAITWRLTPPAPGDPATRTLLERGLLPLYRLFLEEYEARLAAYDEDALAAALRDWRQRL